MGFHKFLYGLLFFFLGSQSLLAFDGEPGDNKLTREEGKGLYGAWVREIAEIPEADRAKADTKEAKGEPKQLLITVLNSLKGAFDKAKEIFDAKEMKEYGESYKPSKRHTAEYCISDNTLVHKSLFSIGTFENCKLSDDGYLKSFLNRSEVEWEEPKQDPVQKINYVALHALNKSKFVKIDTHFFYGERKWRATIGKRFKYLDAMVQLLEEKPVPVAPKVAPRPTPKKKAAPKVAPRPAVVVVPRSTQKRKADPSSTPKKKAAPSPKLPAAEPPEEADMAEENSDFVLSALSEEEEEEEEEEEGLSSEESSPDKVPSKKTETFKQFVSGETKDDATQEERDEREFIRDIFAAIVKSQVYTDILAAVQKERNTISAAKLVRRRLYGVYLTRVSACLAMSWEGIDLAGGSITAEEHLRRIYEIKKLKEKDPKGYRQEFMPKIDNGKEFFGTYLYLLRLLEEGATQEERIIKFEEFVSGKPSAVDQGMTGDEKTWVGKLYKAITRMPVYKEILGIIETKKGKVTSRQIDQSVKGHGIMPRYFFTIAMSAQGYQIPLNSSVHTSRSILRRIYTFKKLMPEKKARKKSNSHERALFNTKGFNKQEYAVFCKILDSMEQGATPSGRKAKFQRLISGKVRKPSTKEVKLKRRFYKKVHDAIASTAAYKKIHTDVVKEKGGVTGQVMAGRGHHPTTYISYVYFSIAMAEEGYPTKSKVKSAEKHLENMYTLHLLKMEHPKNYRAQYRKLVGGDFATSYEQILKVVNQTDRARDFKKFVSGEIADKDSKEKIIGLAYQAIKSSDDYGLISTIIDESKGDITALSIQKEVGKQTKRVSWFASVAMAEKGGGFKSGAIGGQEYMERFYKYYSLRMQYPHKKAVFFATHGLKQDVISAFNPIVKQVKERLESLGKRKSKASVRSATSSSSRKRKGSDSRQPSKKAAGRRPSHAEEEKAAPRSRRKGASSSTKSNGAVAGLGKYLRDSDLYKNLAKVLRDHKPGSGAPNFKKIREQFGIAKDDLERRQRLIVTLSQFLKDKGLAWTGRPKLRHDSIKKNVTTILTSFAKIPEGKALPLYKRFAGKDPKPAVEALAKVYYDIAMALWKRKARG